MAIKNRRKVDSVTSPHIIMANKIKENLSDKDLFAVKFWRKLKEDKMFLLSAIITISFFTIFTIIKFSEDDSKSKQNNLPNVYIETEDGISKDDVSNNTNSNIFISF